MILLELFWVYFKIGLFTIGGGYAMLPMVTREVVDIRGWITQSALNEIVFIAESTPGPFAINLATFVGLSQAGVAGGIVATLAVVLPGFIAILLIAILVKNFSGNKKVKSVLWALRPVVVGLVAFAAYKICRDVVYFDDAVSLVNILLIVVFAIASRVKIKKKTINPILLILVSAVVGVVLFGVIGVA